MTDLSNLKLFATQPHECSYLPEKEATTLFIDPSEPVTPALYSELSHYGFRRSGLHLYRPHCGDCQACIPIRLRVEDFKPSRNQKRCLKRNKDLIITVTDSIKTPEHYALYEYYIQKRHQDGDMYPASEKQYHDFLQSIESVTQYLELRQVDGKLIGIAVSDRLDNALSAIYTFFDPDQPKRSLGVFGILAQIERAKALQLDYVYLGYWIKRCQKMSYKSQYRPFQVLINNQWISVT